MGNDLRVTTGGRSGRGGGGVDPAAVYILAYMMYLTCYCNLIKPAHTQPMELNGNASCIYIWYILFVIVI